MAEIAAGLIVAEEIISTTVEAGVIGGAALAQPTLPLTCILSCVGATHNEADSASLARSLHTLTVIDGKAYIFGGLVREDKLAGNEMHVVNISNAGGKGVEYQCIPAIAEENSSVPSSRAGHSATLVNGVIAVYGGFTDPKTRQPIEESERIWLFNPESKRWTFTDPAVSQKPSYSEHAAVALGRSLITHGGRSSKTCEISSDTWRFDFDTRQWTSLPALLPHHGLAPPSMAIVDGKIYVISGSSNVSSSIFILDLNGPEPPKHWEKLDFPTNPIAPGPRPRQGAGVVPISTGMGRTYLLLILGAKPSTDEAVETSDQDLWSGIWALQLPSPEKTAAKVKDVTREKIGANSHAIEWSEVKIRASEQTSEKFGKAHPGPRAYFGCDKLDDRKILFWGGLNPRGEIEGDGWYLEIEAPGPTSMLKRHDT